MIVTPGEAVRKQAIERFRLRPERVVAVRSGGAGFVRWRRRRDALFLFVGTLEPRKNLAAWWRRGAKARHHPVDLCWPGAARGFPRSGGRNGLRIVARLRMKSCPALLGPLAFVYHRCTKAWLPYWRPCRRRLRDCSRAWRKRPATRGLRRTPKSWRSHARSGGAAEWGRSLVRARWRAREFSWRGRPP